MERERSTKSAGDDDALPCRGQRRAYRHHKRHSGVRLRTLQLVPLDAEQADEAVAALAELVARHRERNDS